MRPTRPRGVRIVAVVAFQVQSHMLAKFARDHVGQLLGGFVVGDLLKHPQLSLGKVDGDRRLAARPVGAATARQPPRRGPLHEVEGGFTLISVVGKELDRRVDQIVHVVDGRVLVVRQAAASHGAAMLVQCDSDAVRPRRAFATGEEAEQVRRVETQDAFGSEGDLREDGRRQADAMDEAAVARKLRAWNV